MRPLPWLWAATLVPLAAALGTGIRLSGKSLGKPNTNPPNCQSQAKLRTRQEADSSKQKGQRQSSQKAWVGTKRWGSEAPQKVWGFRAQISQPPDSPSSSNPLGPQPSLR